VYRGHGNASVPTIGQAGHLLVITAIRLASSHQSLASHSNDAAKHTI